MPSISTDSNMFLRNLAFPPFFFDIWWLLDIINRTLSPFCNSIISSRRRRLWLTLIANCPPLNFAWSGLNGPQLNLWSHFHAFPAIFELSLMLGPQDFFEFMYSCAYWAIYDSRKNSSINVAGRTVTFFRLFYTSDILLTCSLFSVDVCRAESLLWWYWYWENLVLEKRLLDISYLLTLEIGWQKQRQSSTLICGPCNMVIWVILQLVEWKQRSRDLEQQSAKAQRH